MTIMISLIINNEEINTNSIVDKLGSKSKPTVERYLKVARKLNVIEYKGAAKTGGYYLTEDAKSDFKNEIDF